MVSDIFMFSVDNVELRKNLFELIKIITINNSVCLEKLERNTGLLKKVYMSGDYIFDSNSDKDMQRYILYLLNDIDFFWNMKGNCDEELQFSKNWKNYVIKNKESIFHYIYHNKIIDSWKKFFSKEEILSKLIKIDENQVYIGNIELLPDNFINDFLIFNKLPKRFKLPTYRDLNFWEGKIGFEYNNDKEPLSHSLRFKLLDSFNGVNWII